MLFYMTGCHLNSAVMLCYKTPVASLTQHDLIIKSEGKSTPATQITDMFIPLTYVDGGTTWNVFIRFYIGKIYIY